MLRMDLARPAAVRLEDVAWTASPMPGVDRKRLERAAAESGHTTSVVRYAPGSRFRPHVHDGGEEFLVLDGVFSDETGDFPRLTYVRNPIGSKHAPSSEAGCVIFVKLCQLAEREQAQTVIRASSWEGSERLLYEDEREAVRLLRRDPGERLEVTGAELFVIEGALSAHGETYPAWSWIRVPGTETTVLATDAPALIWIKTGHLR